MMNTAKSLSVRGARSALTTLCAVILAGLLNGCASLATNRAEPAPDIRLYVFQCGNITSHDVSLFSPGVNVGQSKQLTDSCYLIRHPQGDLFWDAGLPDGIGPDGIEVRNGAFFLSVTEPLRAQLDAIQVKPEEIEWLGVSHFHSDHTGNANWFNNATLLIQKEEYDAAFGANPQQYGFDPESYNQFNATNTKQLAGDYDVFGDGRVLIKKAVGHTPGHQMLYLDLPNSGPIMLSGDLYHFTSNREHRRVPAFNFDKEQTLQSMEQIEQFVKDHGAQFWIQHDKEQNANIRHAPEYYN